MGVADKVTTKSQTNNTSFAPATPATSQPPQASKDTSPVNLPVTLAVTTAVVIALTGGVPYALASDRVLSPSEPGYIKDLRVNPGKYEAYAAAQEAIARLPKAPAMGVAKKPAPAKAVKAVPKTEKQAKTPVLKTAQKKAPSVKPPSPQPRPGARAAAAAPVTEPKPKYVSSKKEVVTSKFGGIGETAVFGSLVTALFFVSTKNDEFVPTSTGVAKTGTSAKSDASAKANAAVAPDSVAAPANATEAQAWINTWRNASLAEEGEKEAGLYAAEAAQANGKIAQKWIDTWVVATATDPEDVDASRRYADEAAAARAADAQRWIDDWSEAVRNNAVVATKKQTGLFAKLGAKIGGLFKSGKK